MRYNSLFLLLLVPCLVNAQTWSDYLKGNLNEQHSRLEHQMEICDAQKTELPRINDTWFTSLGRDEKFAIASFLSNLVDLRCFGEQQEKYETALIAYSAETGNKELLNEWLKFAKVYRGNAFDPVFTQVDVSPVLNWLSDNPQVKPFDKVIFLEQYAEFKK